MLEDMQEFVLEQLWPIRGQISGQTSLACDFCVAGEDGKEFMEAYSLRFGVDLGDFDWVEYFGPEGGLSILGGLSYIFKRHALGISVPETLEFQKITLEHLVTCANRGKWQAPH